MTRQSKKKAGSARALERAGTAVVDAPVIAAKSTRRHPAAAELAHGVESSPPRRKPGKKSLAASLAADQNVHLPEKIALAPKELRPAAKQSRVLSALHLINGSHRANGSHNGSLNGNGSPANGSAQEGRPAKAKQGAKDKRFSKRNGAVSVNGNAIHPTNGQPLKKANGSRGLENVNGADLEKISRPVLQDRELVNRCLARETGAWSQMYARFHAPLIASVRAFLGQAGRDSHLVEEIAARVWYALVRDEFWLLGRFDVKRGCRLSTFLSLIAKAQARLLLRSERRRRTREHAVARYEIESPDGQALSSLSGEEFVATLSPAERRFLLDVLVATADRDASDRYSSQNLWQLRRRVREKLLKFLE